MEDRAVRPPAVAGSFYPTDRAELASEVARLLAAASPGPAPKAIDLRNSGDTAGDRSRVVGYGAFAFHEPGPRG